MSAPIRDEDLTPEERANGWTAGSLTAYRDERDRAAVTGIFAPRRKTIVVEGQKHFSPFKWARDYKLRW